MLFIHLFLEITLILLLKASSGLFQLSLFIIVEELAVSLCYIARLLSVLGRLWLPLAESPVHVRRLLLKSLHILDMIRQGHVVFRMSSRLVLVVIESLNLILEASLVLVL